MIAKFKRGVLVETINESGGVLECGHRESYSSPKCTGVKAVVAGTAGNGFDTAIRCLTCGVMSQEHPDFLQKIGEAT